MTSSPFYSAYVKIAEGCANHCSYCVIPSIRGTLRSRDIDSVVAEVERLVSEGALIPRYGSRGSLVTPRIDTLIPEIFLEQAQSA